MRKIIKYNPLPGDNVFIHDGCFNDIPEPKGINTLKKNKFKKLGILKGKVMYLIPSYGDNETGVSYCTGYSIIKLDKPVMINPKDCCFPINNRKTRLCYYMYCTKYDLSKC